MKEFFLRYALLISFGIIGGLSLSYVVETKNFAIFSPKTELNIPKANKTDTNPKVWFKPIVDHVLLRDTPSVHAIQVREVNMATWLLWTGIETDFKKSNQNGRNATPSNWIQVIEYSSDYKWARREDIAPFVFVFNLNDTITNSTKRWLILEKSDSNSFYLVRKKAKSDTLNCPPLQSSQANVSVDTLPIVLKVAGQPKVISQRLCDCEGFASYSIVNETREWYIIGCGYWEWADFWFIWKKDGKEYHTLGVGSSCNPLNSPKHRYWAFPSYQGYGDVFNQGVEIFDTKTCRSVGIQLSDENDWVTDVVWETSQLLLFRMEKGGYYAMKINALFD